MERTEPLSVMIKNSELLYQKALQLLEQLIAIPSFSTEEQDTAVCLERFFLNEAIPVERIGNNILVRNRYYDPHKPTLLLNSHHDTVKPNKGYTLDPFLPLKRDGKLYGLGSNDAGGALVTLAAAFLYFCDRMDLPYNLIYAATAEEEISGTGGVERILPALGPVAVAIVGEPTQMQMAVAERGLMVLDVRVTGKAGHAARNEGINALYKALEEIDRLRSMQFEKNSSLLGPVTMNVTSIETENKQHNVVPSVCTYVVDVRVNELYTFEELLAHIRNEIASEVTPRSTRLRSTTIPLDHPLVLAGSHLGRSCYGSPTTSDKALMPFPALKMGPGDSARSHTADEFIHLRELEEGIELYIRLLEHFFQHTGQTAAP